MSTSRLEKFIYAICSMEVSDLPAPLSRIEKLWNCLITGETPDFEPLSRNEKYLMAMLDRYDISNLPAPMSRGEKLLYKIAVGETDLSDVPGYLSRYEELLKYLIENGGIGFEYVLYTLNQSLSTLYNTAEKPVKSAILTGQTLVNTVAFKKANTNASFDRDTNVITLVNSTGWIRFDETRLKPSTKYIIIIDILECAFETESRPLKISLGSGNLNVINIHSEQFKVGRIVITQTTPSTILEDYFNAQTRTDASCKFKLMVIEYQEGMENWDIPYFTGMQSVKMPVLTTTGKNLIDKDKLVDGFVRTDGTISLPDYGNKTTDYIKVKPNTTYSYSTYNIDKTLAGNMLMDLWMYYSDIGTISSVIQTRQQENNKTTISFTTPSDCKYLRIGSRGLNQEGIYVQLEESSTTTPYEPFKSNILSTPSDLELRGVGNVKDELNVATGELTERIGEYIIDGNENWEIYNGYNVEGYKSFITTITGLNNLYTTTKTFISGDIKMGSWGSYMAQTAEEMVWNHDPNKIGIKVKNETASNVEELKTFLASNPITVQYELATPIIKTVDLTTVDQDGQPTKLKTFNDITHVEINAENLIPSVDVEVATKINETLSTMGLEHHDISETQNKINQTIDEQTENTDATMLATTEIYENL